MSAFYEFAMEKMMSKWEHHVDFNLSESGVHPLKLGELLRLAEVPVERLLDRELNYVQTNGIDALRGTIAGMYPSAGPENVLVTVGAAEANYLAIHSLLEAGDEMVMVLPNYLQIYGIALNRGVVVREVPLVEAAGWALDRPALEAAVNQKTKLIAVCNPNNPTGHTLSAAEMDALVSAAESCGAWLLADEVYRGAERVAGEETPSFFGRYGRVLAQGSLSKAYGLPGLRLGWSVGPPDALEAMWRRHEYTTICSTVLSNTLANIALSTTVRPRLLERTRGLIRAGFEQLVSWAGEHADELSLIPPDAAAVAFFRYRADINSTELVRRLCDEKSVMIAAGDHFGYDHCLRVSFGLPQDYLAGGLERITELLDELRRGASAT